MNFVGKTTLNINPIYKFLLYQMIKKDLSSHIACDGNSLSTYNIDHKQKMYGNPLYYFVLRKIKKKLEKVVNGRLSPHSMWFNVNRKGGRTINHNHYTLGEDKISGAYYLSKPENSGNIIFNTLDDKVFVKVNTNDLIFFDSKFYHETEENKSNQERIICGFNFLVSYWHPP